MRSNCRLVLVSLVLTLVTACVTPANKPKHVLSEGHIHDAKTKPNITKIPKLVNTTTVLPEPKVLTTEVRHTVVVFDVPVRELLFSLARDSGLDLDIDADINNTISINAIEQPLNRLLDRITQSAALRYTLKNNMLRVVKDLPYLKTYAVDYLSISRTSQGKVSVSTQIESTGQGAGSGNSNAGNNSSTLVESRFEHHFWDSLQANINRILSAGGVLESVTGEGNSNIILNRESGIVAVRATELQHIEVQNFLNEVQVSVHRQVLIEATIVEVSLNDSYQAGVDWKILNSDGGSKVSGAQNITDLALSSRPNLSLSLTGINIHDNELQATLRALETFGDVSVMSSPKIMALNNQTAVLKVVDNLIYFTIDVNVDTSASSGSQGGTLTTFDSELNTVPVGFVMSVTPFIDKRNQVILNVRPTISRVVGFVQDPNPALADAGVISNVPVIQVREVESILKVASGDIAIIGGLMQDEAKQANRGVPILQNLPFVGNAFRFDDDETKKTELVIFLKPTVIRDASVAGDLKAFKNYLPKSGSR